MGIYYTLKDKKPVPASNVHEWSNWFEKTDRIVAKDTVENSRISTVFLGLDHSFGEGPPLLFETLVFDGPLADEMERYRTWEEAEAGHIKMVEKVKAEASYPEEDI